MVRDKIARTIRRLNLHGVIMKLPIFGQAIYDGLSLEFERVDDFRNLVNNSVVANVDIYDSTIEDYELKYGITPISTDDNDSRKDKILQKAQRDGSGGIDWLQDQIRSAGFDLYIHLNDPSVSTVPNFGNFQFGQIQFGGTISYLDPRTVTGEIIASSPNGNIGTQFQSFGAFQFGSAVQFGQPEENTANPRPRQFEITSDSTRWGYFFFLSPFEDRLAEANELLGLTNEEWNYLRKLVMQCKFLRNWAIAQIEII